jgi:hypothetical protein
MSATLEGDQANYNAPCSFTKDRKCELSDLPLTSDIWIEIRGSTSVGPGPQNRTSVMNIPKYDAGETIMDPESLKK